MAAIGFIGGGNMAEALIKGIIASGLYQAKNILVSDIRTERLDFLAKEYGIKTVQENDKLAEKAEGDPALRSKQPWKAAWEKDFD